ncbi:MLO-like protein 6 [Hibiscus syriacus]|uniref:MLO-like protein 6 n=1 Tax=Hibiscus syriacus TaxID=106335 RepID=UPI00192444BE|nr:MLO-like protein 6 [Hibiscus syriacus]
MKHYLFDYTLSLLSGTRLSAAAAPLAGVVRDVAGDNTSLSHRHIANRRSVPRYYVPGHHCFDQSRRVSALSARYSLLSPSTIISFTISHVVDRFGLIGRFLFFLWTGLKSYFWLPFIPLVIILMVGTKQQVIITKMGLKIQGGNVVKGAPLVEPGDDLFWFGRPSFLLFLIHVVLFTNAFQLAFLVWSTYEFTIKSCYHEKIEDIIIIISMGVIIQVLCSYVTLPLYALVNQMGTNMRPTIFDEKVADALKNWHQTAKEQIKQGKNSENTTPFSSRPATPARGLSPVHLLQWDFEAFRLRE